MHTVRRAVRRVRAHWFTVNEEETQRVMCKMVGGFTFFLYLVLWCNSRECVFQLTGEWRWLLSSTNCVFFRSSLQYPMSFSILWVWTTNRDKNASVVICPVGCERLLNTHQKTWVNRGNYTYLDHFTSEFIFHIQPVAGWWLHLLVVTSRGILSMGGWTHLIGGF